MLPIHMGVLSTRQKSVGEIEEVNAGVYESASTRLQSSVRYDATHELHFWISDAEGADNGYMQFFEIDLLDGSITALGTPVNIEWENAISVGGIFMDDEHVLAHTVNGSDILSIKSYTFNSTTFQIEANSNSYDVLDQEVDVVLGMRRVAVDSAVVLFHEPNDDLVLAHMSIDINDNWKVIEEDRTDVLINDSRAFGSLEVLGSNKIAVFYQEYTSEDGWVRMYEIDATNQLVPVGTPFEYAPVQAEQMTTIKVSYNKILLSWHNTEVFFFKIIEADLVSNSFSQGGGAPKGLPHQFADLTKITSDLYLYAYVANEQVITQVVQLDLSNNTVTYLSHNGVDAEGLRLVTNSPGENITHVSATHLKDGIVVLRFPSTSGKIGESRTLKITSEPESIGEILEINSGVYDLAPTRFQSSVRYDATHELHFWISDVDEGTPDGYMQFFEIDLVSGTQTALGTPVNFEWVDAKAIGGLLLDDTHIFVHTINDLNDLYVKVYDLDPSTFQIASSSNNDYRLDTNANFFKAKRVSASSVVLLFKETTDDLVLAHLRISSNWHVYREDEINVITNNTRPFGDLEVIGNNKVAVFYQDYASEDGWARMYEIDGNDQLVPIGTPYEFATGFADQISTIKIDDDRILLVHNGNTGFRYRHIKVDRNANTFENMIDQIGLGENCDFSILRSITNELFLVSFIIGNELRVRVLELEEISNEIRKLDYDGNGGGDLVISTNPDGIDITGVSAVHLENGIIVLRFPRGLDGYGEYRTLKVIS